MFEGELVAATDAVHARVGTAQRELLSLVAEIDRREAWRDSGARDTAHWLAMRYGISGWKAHRWIAAAHALQELPRLSEAFTCGELGIDEVVELTRSPRPRPRLGSSGGPGRSPAARSVIEATCRHGPRKKRS